jgi:uncharacterized protein
MANHNHGQSTSASSRLARRIVVSNGPTDPEKSASTGPAEPVRESDRIVAIDVLRGYALLGILVVNIQAFSMPDATIFNPTAYGDLTGLNRWVWLLTHIVVEQKFMTIFSMLFGAGILLMTQRVEEKGVRSAGLHHRRMTALLAFGLMHAYLVWHGDILVWYALCGFLVYRYRRNNARPLIRLGLGVVAVASLLSLFFGWSMPFWSHGSIEELAQSFQPPARRVSTYSSSPSASSSAFQRSSTGRTQTSRPGGICGIRFSSGAGTTTGRVFP